MHVEHLAWDPLPNNISLNLNSHRYYLAVLRAPVKGPLPPSRLPQALQLTYSLSCDLQGLSQSISVCPVAAVHRVCLSLISPPSLERRNDIMSGKDL